MKLFYLQPQTELVNIEFSDGVLNQTSGFASGANLTDPNDEVDPWDD